MKKLLALLLAICMILSMFVGCGGSSADDEDDDEKTSDEAEKEEDEDEDENQSEKDPDADDESDEDEDADKEDDKEDDKNDGKDDTKTEQPVDVSIEETVVYDENDIKITVTGLEEGWSGMDVKVLVENNTEDDVYLSVDTVIVNGVTMYGSGYVEVSAGQKANDTLTIYSDELERAGVVNIATIQFVDARIVNADTYDTLFEFQFEVVTSLGEDYVQTVYDEGEVVYDEDGITVIMQGMYEEEYYGTHVQILVINDTDKDIVVEVEDVNVNGYTMDAWLYDSVYAGTVCYCLLDLYESELEENEITEVETIEMEIVLIDWDTYTDIAVIENVVVKAD